MSDGLWVVIGVIIGVIGPLVARFIWDWYTRPILVIEKDEPHESPYYVHHSIRIRNGGRTAARNCNAVLTVMGITVNDVIDNVSAHITTNAYRPIIDESLCWALQTLDSDGKLINPAFLSIFPGSTRLVELYGVARQSLQIEIPSEMGWEIRRVMLRGNREYEIELKIFAENVRYNPKKHRAKFKLIPIIEKKDVLTEQLRC
jgi:hypothetical protein